MAERVEIPFVGPHATNRERPLSSQISRNMWAEINPEARNQVAMHNMAGTRVFATLEGVDRGMHKFNNLMYAVNGGSLYSIDADGVNRLLGSIGGLGRCIMANDQLQLIITTGDTPYRYTVAGGVEAITDPDLVKPTCVAYLNSQFLFDQNDGVWGEFVTSSIDPELSIDALDFANAESHPDDIIRIIAFRQLAYMFGSDSVEPWANVGSGNPPWARVSSGVQPYGLAGLESVVTTEENIYFLDSKRIPRRSNGLNFVNIGNPSIGVEFAKYSKIDDCICFEFSQDNQQFVAFTFPTANRTWVFHEETGAWSQMSHGVDDDRHRASSMLNIYGLNYCADHTNGLVYEYSLDIYSDNGDPIIKERSTATIHGGLYGAPGKRLWFDEVEFIIVGGQTEVEGTGLGPQPIGSTPGVCGTTDDLDQGELLNVGAIQMVNQLSNTITLADASAVSFDDSKVFSFTAAFMRENEPPAGKTAHIMLINKTTDVYLSIYMDENGYIKILGANSAASTILDVTIKNDGGSFADSTLYLMGCVIDLSDVTKREVFVNARNVAALSSWVTWNTYTDDTLHLSAADGGTAYTFGAINLEDWGELSNNGTAAGGGIDALCYVTFDDTCNLISGGMWDNNDWVVDPGAWEGWYKTQPKVFFGPSFWRNSGTTGPTVYNESASLEKTYNQTQPDAGGYYMNPALLPLQNEAALINLGIGGTTEAELLPGGSLPPAPSPDPQDEIVAPFWENTGNWIDLTLLDNTTFAAAFGVAVENADFNAEFAVGFAALVNTSDADNRLQIQNTSACTNAALYITDASGNVVDSMIYAGVDNGNSVLIPTGANYYVVITSDTGNAGIKKWDATEVSTVGSVSWESFFGRPFDVGEFYNELNIIPQAGVAIRFTIPDTSTAYRCDFTLLEVPSRPGIRIGSVNQTVGDYTSSPSYSWGLGGGIDGGINQSGTDIDLIPGQTYFFNVKHTEPYETVYIQIQVSTLAF